MTGPSTLRTPESHRPIMEAIARLPEASFERFVDALEAQGGIFDATSLESSLRNEVPELGDDELSNVGDMLLSLDRLRERRRETPEELAEALMHAEGASTDEAVRDAVRQRLARVLAVDSLRSSGKALDLLYANERNYFSARVVTELRPVFNEDPAEAPRSAVLSHRLELMFFGASGDSETIHIGLDEEDLADLEGVLQRAQAKTQSLTSLLASTPLRIINSKAQERDS